jgi:hypothetical protein
MVLKRQDEYFTVMNDREITLRFHQRASSDEAGKKNGYCFMSTEIPTGYGVSVGFSSALTLQSGPNIRMSCDGWSSGPDGIEGRDSGDDSHLTSNNLRVPRLFRKYSNTVGLCGRVRPSFVIVCHAPVAILACPGFVSVMPALEYDVYITPCGLRSVQILGIRSLFI